METAANQLLEVLAAFGLGILLVLGIGFWLFHKLKWIAEPRTPQPPASDRQCPQILILFADSPWTH